MQLFVKQKITFDNICDTIDTLNTKIKGIFYDNK